MVGQTKGGFVSITPTSVPRPDDVEHQLPGRRHPGQRPDGEAAGRRRIWLVYKAAGRFTDGPDPRRHRLLPAGRRGLLFHAAQPRPDHGHAATSLLSGLTGVAQPQRRPARSTPTAIGACPPGATAVTGNLTVTGQTKGRLRRRSRRTTTADPTTSTINFPLGDTRANGVTVPLNGSGNMSLIYRAAAGKRPT